MTMPGDMPRSQGLVVAEARLQNDKVLSFRQIGLLAEHAWLTRDMAQYVKLFTKIEPQLEPHFEHHCRAPEFIPRTGKVLGNVNVYRKLRYSSFSGPVKAFEKIYQRNGDDLRRLQWVYRNLVDELPFAIPRIVEIVHGQRLSVVIFKFEPFSRISPDGLIETLCTMNEFSSAHPASQFDMIDGSMQQLPHLYKSRRKILATNLVAAGFTEQSLSDVERACMDTVHVFNHGDLHRSNVSETRMIYDWDCACFAPEEHDLGRAVAALRAFTRPASLRKFIRNRLGRIIAQDDTRIWRIMFFYLVYAAKKLAAKPDDAERLNMLREVFIELRAAMPAPRHTAPGDLRLALAT